MVMVENVPEKTPIPRVPAALGKCLGSGIPEVGETWFGTPAPPCVLIGMASVFSERASSVMLLRTSGSGLGCNKPTFTDKGTIRKPQPRERGGRWQEACKPRTPMLAAFW